MDVNPGANKGTKPLSHSKASAKSPSYRQSRTSELQRLELTLKLAVWKLDGRQYTLYDEAVKDSSTYIVRDSRWICRASFLRILHQLPKEAGLK